MRYAGLEDEREGGRLLEADAVRAAVDVRGRHGDELRMRAVHVLADDEDARAAFDARVDDDSVAFAQPFHSVAERGDAAGTVGAEDARLGTDGRPARSHRSRWLTDAATRRTSTSPGPGVGSGASS